MKNKWVANAAEAVNHQKNHVNQAKRAVNHVDAEAVNTPVDAADAQQAKAANPAKKAVKADVAAHANKFFN